MNPLQRIPEPWRIGLYLAYGVGGPLLEYTASRGWTGPNELGLWAGLGAVFGLTAAANVLTARGDYAARHDRDPEP